MLYFYKSISPHPIENLHTYLHFFFTQLFAETSPTYDHAIHIHADFKATIDKNKVQVDDKLNAIFAAYMALQPIEKQSVKDAYANNNNVTGICNMTVVPVKYDALPIGFRTPIESLYDNLWGDNKILGYTNVVAKCGTLKEHFTKFRETNDYSVCPFCGIDSLICKSDDGKDDYDHYLPKSKYPFISVNFENLLPMCHNCNSKNKGQVDTPFVKDTTTQRPLYYPLDNSTPNHEIKLAINATNYDLSNPASWTLNIVCEPAININKKEAWAEIFKIEKRYKSIIADESKVWKGWIFEKHRKLCKKNGVAYPVFHEDAVDDFNDCFNINKGVLMDTFYKFVLNDPNCESYLTGNVTV